MHVCVTHAPDAAVRDERAPRNSSSKPRKEVIWKLQSSSITSSSPSTVSTTSTRWWRSSRRNWSGRTRVSRFGSRSSSTARAPWPGGSSRSRSAARRGSSLGCDPRDELALVDYDDEVRLLSPLSPPGSAHARRDPPHPRGRLDESLRWLAQGSRSTWPHVRIGPAEGVTPHGRARERRHHRGRRADGARARSGGQGRNRHDHDRDRRGLRRGAHDRAGRGRWRLRALRRDA